MGKAEIGKLVRYMQGGKELVALITDSEEGGIAYLTVFGRFGQLTVRAEYSETLIEGRWSWAKTAVKKS